MKPVRRVAVLGAGTMGSRIAAHFANAGFPVLLLDVVRTGERNRNAAAVAGIERALKQKPGAFFTPAAAALVTPGNFEDDLAQLAGCDWILEAVAEDLEIKRNLFYFVAAVRTEGTIVSTNTSGIPLAKLSEGFSDEFRSHFLGTHFFNPPRYLHLVEVIPCDATSPEVVDFVRGFCDRRLGKGVVPCKDTPNFIANRIGSFFGATVHQLTVEGDYTVEEVDALTGPLIGLPRSASYRLMDIVGLDIWSHVTRNLYDAVPDDPWRDRFVLPGFMLEMIERGWIGDKSGQGFYKRVGPEKQLHAIDRENLEYHPVEKPEFASVEAVRQIEDLAARLRALIAAPDRAGIFLWNLFCDLFAYSASMVPEISDRVVEIDRAMRWGYAHELGPFELWDALGVEETVTRMHAEGRAVPENVRNMLASGATSFYSPVDRAGCPGTVYFDLNVRAYRDLEPREGIIVLSDWKRARGVVSENGAASLIDLGDGVLCLEFHGGTGAQGDDAVDIIGQAVDQLSGNFQAMVIAYPGGIGRNLEQILVGAQEGKWSEANAVLDRIQKANQTIKYSPRPVVAAPIGMTVDRACELVLHADRAQAGAETQMGLLDVGVGLIPTGGGCKELTLRLGDPRAAFDLIGFAKTSSSAADARDLGFLRPFDGISMNRERLIADAKASALSLAASYSAASPRPDIAVGGDAAYALIKLGIYMAQQGGYISDYDVVIGEKLAYVLCGGRLSGRQSVSEQYLLDLEREAYLSLLGNTQTQERIAHMLKTGKPLRNYGSITCRKP